MDDEELFAATISELEGYLSKGDDYSMLRAAALLRQLLLDESPLIHRVNRTHRLKLRFIVCGRPYREVVLTSGPTFYSALGGIHTSGPFPHQAEELALDQFLSVPVLKLGNETLAIKDLITISANVLGGVHKGDPKAEKEQALHEFNKRVTAFGQTIGAAQMKPVIVIALEALEPLRKAANVK